MMNRYFSKSKQTFAIFILIIFLLSTATLAAQKLSIYPSELKLLANPSEEICTTIYLQQVNITSDILVQDRWAREGIESKQLQDYKLTAEELRITINYPKIIDPSQKSIEVCLSAKNAGTYSGALLFKVENTQIGLGNWITLRVPGDKPQSIRETLSQVTTRLTGNTIGQISSKTAYVSLELVFLLILLITLIVINKRIKIKEQPKSIITIKTHKKSDNKKF